MIERPGTYYMGSPSGGLWKSTDAGAVWRPIFDQTNVASIGAVAVAPSNPEIVYVGTGDFGAAGTAFGAVYRGDGIWRSDDAGRTWLHVGLTDTEHIGKILSQPLTVRRDPRETTTEAAFAAQFALEQKLMAGMKASYQGI